MKNIRFKRNNIIGYTEVYIDGKLSKYAIEKCWRTGSYWICENHERGKVIARYQEAKEYIINLIG